MQVKKDIVHIEDIKLLVDTFYEKIRANELLGPIFNGRIKDRWPEHLDKMYRFWQTVLLEEHTYSGSPFMPHATMPLEGKHFDAWISLFVATVDELFAGEKATEIKLRAANMATMFLAKIEYSRKHAFKPVQ
jgi:hemoglobin